MTEIFELLNIPIEEWTLYQHLIEYQLWKAYQVHWITYISGWLWLGVYMAWLHRFIYGTKEYTRYYLERW